VRILYATVTAADRERFLHNGYSFLCYLLSLALGFAMLVVDAIAGRNLIRSPVLALAVIGGFWEYYTWGLLPRAPWRRRGHMEFTMPLHTRRYLCPC